MSYFVCKEMKNTTPIGKKTIKSINNLVCPFCNSELLYQGYADCDLDGLYDLRNTFIYKCSDIQCGEVFLTTDLKSKIGIVK